MIEWILGIGVAAFVVYAGFSIAYLISVKRTSDELRKFTHQYEAGVHATLTELLGTLENIRKITGDVSAVTGDVKQISNSIAGLEKGIRDFYEMAKAGIGQTAEANIAGLKAGISAGVASLVRNVQEKGSDEHERRTGN